MKANRTSFLDLFPPPRFLEMPTVGLDMSDEIIRFVELKRKGSHFVLGNYGEEKIPKDLIDEGYIKDKVQLIEVLARMKQKYNLQFIKASLPEEKSYLFKTDIPMMNERDIRGALQYKIEENVPLSLKDAIYDYRIIKHPLPGDKNLRISVTVVHVNVIEHYLEVFKGAGLSPMVFQVESHALANVAVPRHADETFILIALRENRTLLAIVSEGEVQFTSTIHVGGSAIAASLQKNVSISPEEVVKIRDGKETRASNEMFLSLVSAASALRDEVQKLLVYWDNHSQEVGHNRLIEKIIISGSDALLGIDEYLNKSLDIKTTIADPWVNVLDIKEYLPPLTKHEALDYLPAIGLALPND